VKSDFNALLPSGKVGGPIASAVTPPGELASPEPRFASFFDDLANRCRKSAIFHSVHDHVRHAKLP